MITSRYGSAGRVAQQAVGVHEPLQRTPQLVQLLRARVGMVVPLGLLGPDEHVEAVAPPARGDRAVQHRAARLVEHVGHRCRRGPRVERDRGVGLGVEVHHERAHVVLQRGAGKPERDGGLADPALQAQCGDHEHGDQPTSFR
jgi:hypothetical protein